MFDLNKLQDMIKNATQIQEKMSKELASKSVEASAGAGMVKINMNGQFEATSVFIEPSLLARNDLIFMQDLIQAAINDATQQVRRLMADQARSLGSQFNLPTA